MPKLPTSNQLTMKISIAQIVETGNVRQEYNLEEIKLLADSIYKYGLINPISVKQYGEDDNGIKLYELIAGHRRLRAHKYLCDLGQDYSQITACIVKGDKDILQLIENIQREDLSQIDKETAIKALVSSGMSQQQIAEELSKPLGWIHDQLAGTEVRENAEAAGIDTTGMSTKALSQLASIPGDKLPEAVNKAKSNGGTVKAATQALNDYRVENGISAPRNKKKIEPKVYQAEPILIDIQNVISEIRDYQHRQNLKLNSHDNSLLNNICCDLISLFEAYQHN